MYEPSTHTAKAPGEQPPANEEWQLMYSMLIIGITVSTAGIIMLIIGITVSTAGIIMLMV